MPGLTQNGSSWTARQPTTTQARAQSGCWTAARTCNADSAELFAVIALPHVAGGQLVHHCARARHKLWAL